MSQKGSLQPGGSIVFNADSGSASTDNREITIVGGTNLTTSASASTITIDGPATGAPISWTPQLMIDGATTGITYTTQRGSYLRQGRLVFFEMNIALSSKGTQTGLVTLSGLPISPTTQDYNFGYMLANHPTTFEFTQTLGLIRSINSAFNVLFQYIEHPSVIATNLTNAQLNDNSDIRGSGFFFAAS